MAFSDQQAGRARAIVLIVALIVVAALAVAVVSGVFSPAAQSGDQSGQEQATSADGSETSTDGSAMESIDAQYGTAAQQLASQYEADPTNPSTLLNLANGYFDWGVAAMNHAASDEDSAHARELLARAVEYYDTYLADNPGAKSATVDRAICVFYAGDTDQAIEALEALSPTIPRSPPHGRTSACSTSPRAAPRRRRTRTAARSRRAPRTTPTTSEATPRSASTRSRALPDPHPDWSRPWN